jgi:hypothetical protein
MEICGKPLTSNRSKGKSCARVAGHARNCRSAEYLKSNAEYQRNRFATNDEFREQHRKDNNKRYATDPVYRERRLAHNAVYRAENPAQHMLKRVRENSDVCMITVDDIKKIMQDHCAYCGCEWGVPNTQQAPSLDKIIPALGYVSDNIAVCCKECNRRKDNMSPEDMRKMADAIEAEICRQLNQ